MAIESQQKLQQRDLAPEFELPGIDGEIYALQDLPNNKGLLVIFMCNHCPYVKARMQEINELRKQFSGSIAFVGINSNDPDYDGEGMDNMKEFAKEYGMEFPYLMDEDGEVAKAYGATCTPDPFLFDQNLELVFHGRISDALQPDDEVTEETMKDVIMSMLAGESIDPWFNPSLGCSIKFKD